MNKELSKKRNSKMIGLDDYVAPPMPADEWLKTLSLKVRATFGRSGHRFVEAETLQRATLRRLDEAVAPPACGPIVEALDATIGDWISGPTTAERVKAVILPPCDSNDVVGTWGRRAGLPVIAPGDESDASSELARLQALNDDDDGIVVIPQLERWYLRRLGGLEDMRRLIALLSAGRRRIVIGCNAWSWAYLSKACGIDMLVGEPICFAPFSGDKLREWFGELAHHDLTRGVRFRLADDGTDVLAMGDNEKTKAFFDSLAAHSRGIPWVAWHIWRRALHEQTTGNKPLRGGETDASIGETLWVAELETLVLPGDQPRDALLILHSLLLHEQMSVADLASVLPIVGGSVIPAALAMGGFLKRDGDRLSIRPEAYPAIREGLKTAAMSLGKL